MKQKFRRWYEKNEYLHAFMNLMRDLPIDIQCEIAIDMIMKASEMIDRDYTKIIQDVADFNPHDYKRWYDKNPNIHLAIESLRDLDDNQKEEIVKEFCDKILTQYPQNFNLDEIEEIKEDE